jgi:HKD family nuclease
MSQNPQAEGLLGSGNVIVIGLPRSFDLYRELASATEIRLATAFAHWSGWNLVRDSIKQSKGSAKLLTGLAFCQSEPRVLQDWCRMSRENRIRSRLFADKKITFHPKVLIVKNPTLTFAVIGSGNLSAGGLKNNIECNYFTTDTKSLLEVTSWFDGIFESDTATKVLNDADIRRYRPRYEKAKKAKNSVRALQLEAELDISNHHLASLRKWKHAVARAKRFFSSNNNTAFRRESAAVGSKVKSALDYPNFNFDREGFEKFYKILELGHLIEFNKPSVWKQRAKLRRTLRLLVDNSISIEHRLSQILDEGAPLNVSGVGLNFISKILAVHAPRDFTVQNAPVNAVLEHFEYNIPRGHSPSQKYLAFCELMRRFLAESGARNTLELDVFFFEYWDRFLKPIERKRKQPKI